LTIKAKNRTPKQWRVRANILVWKAVTNGKLIRLGSTFVKCADCGERATDYDHRDYRKALKVEPVCRKCNLVRGPGKPWPTGYTGKPRRGKSNGDLWGGIDGGDGDTCFWFNGHVLVEPDEKLLEQHEEYVNEFRMTKELNPYWGSDVEIAMNELFKMAKKYSGQKGTSTKDSDGD
jgi:hypothetical protein